MNDVLQCSFAHKINIYLHSFMSSNQVTCLLLERQSRREIGGLNLQLTTEMLIITTLILPRNFSNGYKFNANNSHSISFPFGEFHRLSKQVHFQFYISKLLHRFMVYFSFFGIHFCCSCWEYLKCLHRIRESYKYVQVGRIGINFSFSHIQFELNSVAISQ